MRAQLIKRFNDVQASYWFIPICMVLGALCLTQILTSPLVQSYDKWLYANTWVSATEVDGARVLLSIVSGSILGVAGVTFSITIVAVSFASSNFGPRLINNFMSDRGSQLTLGTFLGTFVYCLVVLNRVQGSSSDAAQQVVEHQIPQLATLMALPLALACIGVLIYFIHHIVETINIENIVASIGSRLIQRTRDNFPGECCAKTSAERQNLGERQQFDLAIEHKKLTIVEASSLGYVQAVDYESLRKIANEQNYHVLLHYGPGDFISTCDQLMNVWSESGKETLRESELRGCFAVGAERTEHQNTLFLVEQLAEVIARAMSPGVNDPYTAISCLNQYKSALSAYLNRDDSHDYPEDQADGRLRLPILRFDRLVKAMFDPCRQYISADKNVSLHAISVLATCAWQAGRGDAQSALIAQMQLLEQSAALRLKGTVEALSITERYHLALRHLDDSRGHPLTGTSYYWDRFELAASSTDEEDRPVRK